MNYLPTWPLENGKEKREVMQYRLKQLNILRGFQVLVSKKYKKNSIRVFYGGAIKGNVGGTLVKVKRLNKYFKEHKVIN